MSKLLLYNHPAASKYKVGKHYTLDELQKDMSIDRIKVLFKPVNFEWEKAKAEPKTELEQDKPRVEQERKPKRFNKSKM